MHNTHCPRLDLVSGKTTNKKTRNTSFELLRIIAMFSITICHLATHGKFDFDLNTLSLPRFWWYFIELGGNFGVNVFVLISGYFLIFDNSGTFNIKKILKLWGQVFFYSMLIYVTFGLCGISEFSVLSFIKSFFPMTFGSYWFASTYFVLYLLHPFLNMFLSRMDKITFQRLLVLLLIMWCVIPSFTFSEYQSNKLLWFITLYSLAAYIRFFGLNPIISLRHYICFFILSSLLRFLSGIVLIIIGTHITFAATHALAFYGIQSVLTLLSALSIFMVFKSINLGYHKWINIIASATFGVYLIHDNRIIRKFLWEELFKVNSYSNSALLIPYSICVVLLIYTVCTIIDLLRQILFEKAFLYVIENKADSFINQIKVLITMCIGCIFGNSL